MVDEEGRQGFTDRELYDIGNRIHDLCKEKGVKMKDLSEKLNISKEQLSNITNGRCKRISAQHICIIAGVLGTSTDFILTGRKSLIDRPGRLSKLEEKLDEDETTKAVRVLKVVFDITD